MSIRDWEQAKVSIERRTFKINCWEKMQTKCFRYGEGGRIKTTWPDLEFGRYTAILLIVQLRAKFIYLFTFDVWWELGSELQNGSHTAAVMLLLRRSASEIIFLHAFLPNNMCLSFSLPYWQIHSHLAKDLMFFKKRLRVSAFHFLIFSYKVIIIQQHATRFQDSEAADQFSSTALSRFNSLLIWLV